MSFVWNALAATVPMFRMSRESRADGQSRLVPWGSQWRSITPRDLLPAQSHVGFLGDRGAIIRVANRAGSSPGNALAAFADRARL
jgi:hypothetical protein